MKKIFLACLFILLSYSFVLAQAAVVLPAPTVTKIWSSPVMYKYVYAVTTSVTTGTDVDFQAITFDNTVKVIDVDFVSDSTDVDVCINEKDNATEIYKRVCVDGFGTGERPPIQPTIVTNMDGTTDKVFYPNISNQTATPTGTSGELSVTIERD